MLYTIDIKVAMLREVAYQGSKSTEMLRNTACFG